jgi:hypothetical protein
VSVTACKAFVLLAVASLCVVIAAKLVDWIEPLDGE